MQRILMKLDEITELFESIRLTFSMNYKARHQCIDDAPDYFDTEIPTIYNDRENMTSDIKAIGTDLKNAIKQKKTELVQ
jgi:hypothetical protein